MRAWTWMISSRTLTRVAPSHRRLEQPIRKAKPLRAWHKARSQTSLISPLLDLNSKCNPKSTWQMQTTWKALRVLRSIQSTWMAVLSRRDLVLQLMALSSRQAMVDLPLQLYLKVQEAQHRARNKGRPQNHLIWKTPKKIRTSKIFNHIKQQGRNIWDRERKAIKRCQKWHRLKDSWILTSIARPWAHRWQPIWLRSDPSLIIRLLRFLHPMVHPLPVAAMPNQHRLIGMQCSKTLLRMMRLKTTIKGCK